MEEVRRLGALEGAEINKAKRVLAFEVTKMIHGEEEAIKAQKASKALFYGGAEEGSILLQKWISQYLKKVLVS